MQSFCRRAACALAVLAIACGNDAIPITTSTADPTPPDAPFCTVPTSQIADGGVGKDGIPALTNPKLVAASHEEAAYLRPGDRIIGFRAGDDVIAVPHNILWWHEVANFDLGTLRIAVTYCPLTGSSVVFDRTNLGGAELGVSGLLYKSNLIMYDRTTHESLWPQMLGATLCTRSPRPRLVTLPAIETTWAHWIALHPGTRVVSSATGWRRDYRTYPYGDYERLDNARTLFPVPIDRRLPPKERVLGIPMGGDGGLAFPFEALAREPRRALAFTHRDGPAIVLWDRDARTAAAFFATVGGQRLSFSVVANGWRDAETGTTWRVDGLATAGPLAGSHLRGVPEAYVAFWFAWALFQPETTIVGL